MNILDKLPYDLQLKIYNYIVFPQNKILLDDIKSYHNNKRLIYIKYMREGLIYNDDYFDNLNIHCWINYELMQFCKDNKKNNDKIVKNNDSKINKFLAYKLKNKNNNDQTMYNFYYNLIISCKININRYIGILKDEERLSFINRKKN
jgi:hypothetical protein